MPENPLVTATQVFMKQKLGSDNSGHHDWWHELRVLRLARHIAAKEKGADMLVVELGALLHDIADWKFVGGDLEAGPKQAREWLVSQKAPEDLIEKVVYIVGNISYRGGTNKHIMQTLEGKIVQDADRLDALGAIGIVRAFTFSGSRNQPIYDPANKPRTHESFDSYRKAIEQNTAINHFYEKLLLLKDKMNTKTGRQLAEDRHKYMEDFLEEFYAEWEGKR